MLVSTVLVTSQEILLQAYVADWPPKPVTNPGFLMQALERQGSALRAYGLRQWVMENMAGIYSFLAYYHEVQTNDSHGMRSNASKAEDS